MAMGVALLASLLPAQAAREAYAWPLDLPRELTSSFGEYRSGRYHMGIDLRTGPIGKNVHAAADGYVSRIRCSPYGYGKAVYLQLNDGNSAVYAHLSEFDPALRDYVRAAQHAREEYTIDLTPKPGEFPIKRGELIAKSGQTGIGVPHLHYELRDSTGVPINPRHLGVTWPDRTAPIIESIAIVPFSPRSIVHGEFRGMVLLGAHDPAGRLRIGGSYGIEGPVGFAVSVFDPAEGGSKLGVYRATLQVDGREVFTVRNDRISYDHAEDGAVAFVKMAHTAPFLRLWRAPGNDAEAYARSASADGTVELQGASADALITAEDFSGNVATLTIPLRRDNPEPAPPPDTQLRGNGSVGFRFNGYSLVATAMFPGDDVDRPMLVVGEERPRTLPLRRMDARRFQIGYMPNADFADVTFTLKHPRLAEPEHRFVFIRRGTPARRVTFGDLEVAIQPESPYGTLAFEARPVDAEPATELRPLGPAYDLQPFDLVVDAPITLSLPLPDSSGHPERALLYRRDVEKKKWVRQNTEHGAGRASAATRQLGVYALLEDAAPPQLEILRPAPKDAIASRRPVLRARAVDGGSGVDAWRVTYNGKWLLVEYDPEQDLLTWERDEDLPAGTGTLAVEVRDHAGNVARRELTLKIEA